MSIKSKILIIIAILIIAAIFFVRPYYAFITKTLGISPLKTIFSNNSIKKTGNQVNFVLLGVSGDANHDGEYLSDSIIVASYNLTTNNLTTISIPRDIWSETLKDKINSAYAYGGYAKDKVNFNPKDGMTLAKAEISDIVGFPIHYALVVNFNGFKKLIDYLGGIDVNVENSFVDNEYPIAGKENDTCNNDPEYKCRYETVSFDKGLNHMDGETALKFVRSRHAEGEEGTDFARESRQQKMIEAIKNSLIAKLKKFDLNELKSLYQISNEIVLRDISNQQLSYIAKNFITKGNFSQKKIILDDSLFTNPPLSSPDYDGAWVLIPKDDGFKTIHQYINCYIEGKENCESIKK